jgi:hypothetical protein
MLRTRVRAKNKPHNLGDMAKQGFAGPQTMAKYLEIGKPFASHVVLNIT